MYNINDIEDNYSAYLVSLNLSDLEGIAEKIDGEKYPRRKELVLRELAVKQLQTEQARRAKREQIRKHKSFWRRFFGSIFY